MQAESESISEFSERTERLAQALSVRLTDLPSVMGLSEDMLFGCRKGRYPISKKTWRKLEQAERDAGVVSLKEQLVKTPREQQAELIQGASTQDLMSLYPPDARVRVLTQMLETKAERLREDLHHFFEAVGGLAQCAARAAPMVEKRDKELSRDLRYFAEQLPRTAAELKPRVVALCDFMSSGEK